MQRGESQNDREIQRETSDCKMVTKEEAIRSDEEWQNDDGIPDEETEESCADETENGSPRSVGEPSDYNQSAVAFDRVCTKVEEQETTRKRVIRENSRKGMHVLICTQDFFFLIFGDLGLY